MNQQSSFVAKILLFITLFTLSLTSLQGQERAEIAWKNSIDSTFVFEISNKEAEKFLKEGGSDELMKKLLHTQVATFVGEWKDAPQQGHFIYANIRENNISYRYAPITPFQVFLFREYGLLTLQVIDGDGEVIENAKVKIQRGKWRMFDSEIAFDKESKTYTEDDWSESRQRILTVEHNKFKAIFDLEKHFVNPWYGGNYGSRPGPDFYSYMLTDKNMYKPGESVRFKSYALSGGKSPIKKDLELWIKDGGYYSDNFSKKVTSVSPYNPGGFAGEVLLHDSLELRLDTDYRLQLIDKKGKIVSNTKFRYEDYELYDNKMETKIGSSVHYFPDTNHVEIKVVDANGLILPDQKVVVSITRSNISRSYVDLLVTPYAVLQDTIQLDNDQPTIYKIPPQLFEKTDCSYGVNIETITHDGQQMRGWHNVSFFKSYYSIASETKGDSIVFKYYELGKEKEVAGQLFIDDDKNPIDIKLPYIEVFKQNIKRYVVYAPETSTVTTVHTARLQHGLGIKGGLVKDSLRLEMLNPLKLEMSWYLYQGNMLLEKGSGTEFSYEQAYIDLDIMYYLEVFYTIGGEDQVYRKIYEPKKEYLNIETNLPDRIFPGQTVDTKIKVTDSRGSGVKGVDLTAFAFNTLLEYSVPNLPYYGNTPKGREERNSYDINRRQVQYNSALTQKNYNFWNKIAGLENMKYYQFTFPDPAQHDDLVFSPSSVTSYADIPYHDIFKHTVDSPEGLTEFAPFVMQGGRKVNIYAIELNDKPVYFNWTEQPKTYSFLVKDHREYHKIMIRLWDRAIILDNYCFDEGKKTVISLNLDNMPESKYVRTVMLHNKRRYDYSEFTDAERSHYAPYISKIPLANDRYTYMTQNGIKFPIYHPKFGSYKSMTTVGPFNEGYYRYMDDGERYLHEGGFYYKYADNVIYKYPSNNIPTSLSYHSDKDFSMLNDYYLTEAEFVRQIGVVRMDDKWFPKIVNLSHTKLHVPNDSDTTGVHSIVMRNSETGKLFVPAYKRNVTTSYSYKNEFLFGIDKMEHGNYDVFALYNNGKYLQFDSVPLLKGYYTEVNMDKCIEHPRDSMSMKWLEYNPNVNEYSYVKTSTGGRPDVYTTYHRPRSVFSAANDVQGIVEDGIGEPLVGVSIVIEGTTIGTITDLDGKFIIDLHGSENTLVFSYIGFETKKVQVTRGSTIKVVMEESASTLDEVVVVGYGTQKKMSMTGSISTVRSDSMAGSAREESLDVDDDTIADTADAEEDDEVKLYEELKMLDGMRTNFSDVGFWQPALVTNRKGEVEFEVTFPDNLTEWEAIVYAMNKKLKTGTFRKRIKSYKPLMAELKAPQFLVVGDESDFSTSIRNYTKDKEIDGSIEFILAGDTLLNKDINFETSYLEKMPVVAQDTDSLTASYRFTRSDGYSDGEQRSISIEKQGTKVAEGTLQFLRANDEIKVEAKSGEQVHISITGNQVDIYMDAANYLRGYEYACNEQLASKLIGILNYKLYQKFNNEEFKNDKEISAIIKRLLENQNRSKLWSWWGNDPNSSFWMSAHILKALRMAKDAGYYVNLDIRSIEYDYIDIHRFRHSSLVDIDVLNALIDWGTEQSYEPAIEMFEEQIAKNEAREDSLVKIYKKTKRWEDYAVRNSYMRDKLVLTEMRQKLNLEYDKELIINNLKKDVLGSVRIVDTLQCRYWYYNNDAANIIAYRIMKNDSTLMQYVDPMQMHILSTKNRGWNTYQASSAVAAILPDLLAQSASKDALATVKLVGRDNKTLTEFPYNTILEGGQNLTIKKEAGIPLIYSAYTIERRTEQNFGEAFEVTTTIESSQLKKGAPTRMRVDVKVKQENAEHIIIEIPIPAGCSYASKNQGYGRYEVHREYFKEKVSIFCAKLPEGDYSYYIDLLPRYTGSYTLNPAKIELMYFPVINANNDMRKVNIGE